MEQERNGSIYIAYDRSVLTSADELTMMLAVNWAYDGPSYFLSELEAHFWVVESGSEGSYSKVYILKLPEDISLEVMLSDDPTNTLNNKLNPTELEKLYNSQYK